jgi:hypothetical protein
MPASVGLSDFHLVDGVLDLVDGGAVLDGGEVAHACQAYTSGNVKALAHCK